LGDRSESVGNDWGGNYLGESGFLSMRLLLIDCVDVEGNSGHAKLVS